MKDQETEAKVVENSEVEKDRSEAKKAKKGWKKIILYCVLGLVGVLLIFSMSLGFIVKSAVNQFMPPLTGTPVSMGSCFINPFTGTLRIKNFTIGSPEGYQADSTFDLKEVYVDIGILSLFSDKVIIETILVDGMDVTFEATMSGTNVGAIQDNISKATKSEEQAAEEPEETGDQTTEEKSGKKSKGIEIDDFKFINSHVALAAEGTTQAVPLPDIVLTGIGADSPEGATGAEVVSKVMNKLYVAILESVKEISTKDLTENTNKVLDSAKKETDSLIKGVKNMFGGDEK